MDWTLKDNMVDGLFFCVTLTGRRGGHTSFVQAGAETSDTGEEAVKPDPGCSQKANCRKGTLCSGNRCWCQGKVAEWFQVLDHETAELLYSSQL